MYPRVLECVSQKQKVCIPCRCGYTLSPGLGGGGGQGAEARGRCQSDSGGQRPSLIHGPGAEAEGHRAPPSRTTNARPQWLGTGGVNRFLNAQTNAYTNRHTYSVFMAPPPPPHTHTHAHRGCAQERQPQATAQWRKLATLGGGGTPTTGLRERGNDSSRSTGRSGRQNAATRRNMRREERVTVQGPVKEQQPDGMSHRGGGGGCQK